MIKILQITDKLIELLDSQVPDSSHDFDPIKQVEARVWDIDWCCCRLIIVGNNHQHHQMLDQAGGDSCLRSWSDLVVDWLSLAIIINTTKCSIKPVGPRVQDQSGVEDHCDLDLMLMSMDWIQWLQSKVDKVNLHQEGCEHGREKAWTIDPEKVIGGGVGSSVHSNILLWSRLINDNHIVNFLAVTVSTHNVKI